MLVYGDVLIDIDLGIGRQYGYRDPARALVTADSRVYVATRNRPTRNPKPATCHPDQPHKALGKCACCHLRDWRASRCPE